MAFDFDALTEKLAAQIAELPKDRRAEGLRIVRAKIHNVASLANVETEEVEKFVDDIMRDIEELVRKRVVH